MTDFERVDLNLRACFRALAAGREHAETRVTAGVEVLSLGVQFQMFNAAFLASPVESAADLQRRLATAQVHFSARGVEWSFWLCDGWLPPEVIPQAQRIFSRAGLTLATQMPGMITNALAECRRRLPDCIVREANGRSVLDDFRQVGANCFRVPQAWFDEVFDDLTSQRLPFRAWVGYVDGAPIATAASLVSGGAVGLYNVATLPRFRGRGYAEAVMRECLRREQASAEPLPVVLQSTTLGLQLYEQMGLRGVTRFRVWVS